MKAVSCCSGGVMFVPDSIEREKNSKVVGQSYKDLVGEDSADDALREKIFEKSSDAAEKSLRTAA